MSEAGTFAGREDGGFDPGAQRVLEDAGLSFIPGAFASKPTMWSQLVERPEDREGSDPENQLAVVGTHSLELAGHIYTTEGQADRKLVFQTILSARRLYQELVVLDEADIQGNEDFRHGEITLAIDLLPEVSHVRLLFATEYATSPLKTWQLAWLGREAAPGMHIDMKAAPILGDITGNPK